MELGDIFLEDAHMVWAFKWLSSLWRFSEHTIIVLIQEFVYVSDGDASQNGEETPAEDTFHDARDTLTLETVVKGESLRKTSERET